MTVGRVCDKDSAEGMVHRSSAETHVGGGPLYCAAKRVFDVAFSLVVLVCFSWLLALVAVAVKLDDPSGPILFRQRRVGALGSNGEPACFEMVKFRTMVPDAEERLEELRALNEKTGPVFKMHDDPRVTRVGGWLRKLSLDELPQFWNVLKGDIPLRILKMRQVFFGETKGAFALPAKTSTNENDAFSQVKAVIAANLRTRRVASSNLNLACSAEPVIFAKPIFGAVAA